MRDLRPPHGWRLRVAVFLFVCAVLAEAPALAKALSG